MRQNLKKYKARVLEKTTDNPGVESDNTVIAIENKIWLNFFYGCIESLSPLLPRFAKQFLSR